MNFCSGIQSDFQMRHLSRRDLFKLASLGVSGLALRPFAALLPNAGISPG